MNRSPVVVRATSLNRTPSRSNSDARPPKGGGYGVVADPVPLAQPRCRPALRIQLGSLVDFGAFQAASAAGRDTCTFEVGSDGAAMDAELGAQRSLSVAPAS